MVFAILYGFFCGCFLSLVSAVAAKVYGVERLAGLSGLLLLFNAPGASLPDWISMRHLTITQPTQVTPLVPLLAALSSARRATTGRSSPVIRVRYRCSARSVWCMVRRFISR